MTGFRGPRLRDAREYDQPENKCGQRVADEKQEVIVVRHETGQNGGERKAQVDRPVLVAEGADARGGRNQVRNRRAHGGTVQVGEESQDESEEGDQRQGPRKTQSDHCHRRDEQTYQEHRAAAKPVGQFTAHQLRRERTRAKQRDCQRGLAD